MNGEFNKEKGKRGGKKERRESYTIYENEMYPTKFVFFNQNQVIFSCYILPAYQQQKDHISKSHTHTNRKCL